MPRAKTQTQTQTPELAVALTHLSEECPPAIAFFLQHASSVELGVAYKAMVGLLMGEGLEGEEAEVARRIYLALQRELDRRLHAAILPADESEPLPF